MDHLQSVVLAIIGGLALGTILALMRLSGIRILAVPAKAVCQLFPFSAAATGIALVYFAVPMVYNLVTGTYLTLDTRLLRAWWHLWCLKPHIFLRLYVRVSSQLAKGQVNAAKALGMTYGQTMRFIILPQAFRKMFAAYFTTVDYFVSRYHLGVCDWLGGFLPSLHTCAVT